MFLSNPLAPRGQYVGSRSRPRSVSDSGWAYAARRTPAVRQDDLLLSAVAGSRSAAPSGVTEGSRLAAILEPIGQLACPV